MLADGHILPPGWAEVQLDDVIVDGPSNGFSPVCSDNGKGPLVLKLTATTRGVMRIDEETTKRAIEPIDRSARGWLVPGDILVQRANSLEYLGATAIYEGPPATIVYPDLMMRIRAADYATARYLWRWLNADSARRYFRANATGTAGNMPKINAEVLRRTPILLPPLNEQRRIVAKLDVIFEQTRAAKARLERLPSLLDKLKRSILVAAFRGDLTADWRAAHPNVEPASDLLDRIRSMRRARWDAELRAKGKDPTKAKYDELEAVDDTDLPAIPPTWAWSTVGGVLEGIEAGRSPKAHGRPASSDEFGVLKVSAVTWGRFLPLENKALVSGDIPDPDLLVRRGDLLITRANTVELVGAVALVDGDYPNLMLSDKTLRLVPVKNIDREFLLYALRTAEVRRVFEGDATGTSDSMRNITQDKIRAAPIAVAPAAEQREIARRLAGAFAAVDALCERVERATARVGDVERASLAKAFRGELVPQDLNDEPASRLLARVRTELASRDGKEKNASGRPRRTRAKAAKDNAHVLTRKGVSKNHLTAILKERGALTAEALWKASQLEIDDFYDQLKDEESRGLLRENRESTAGASRLLEHAS